VKNERSSELRSALAAAAPLIEDQKLRERMAARLAELSPPGDT